MMEGLEQRQLLTAAPIIPTIPGLPTQPVNTFTGARNIGTVSAFAFNESESAGSFGNNDSIFTADFVPLGTGPGQKATIDIRGSLPVDSFINLPPPQLPLLFNTDLDVYAFDLRAGDILDISTLGAVGTIDISYENGLLWFATDRPEDLTDTINGEVLPFAPFYPEDSPLQTLGVVGASQVVPETGRYYLTVSPGDLTENYTIGLRVYRPVAEKLPIGGQQYVFLDFDGAIYPRNVFTDLSGVPQTGIIRIPSLFESLPDLGFQGQFGNTAEQKAIENRLINQILEEVELQFASIAKNGGNGDYDSTGVAGQYGLTVLNSRDHVDPVTIPGLNQITTRVLVGGTEDDAEQQGLLGISSTLDIGNFSMDDIVLVLLDGIEDFATQFPISNTTSVLDVMARGIAVTITHESAHSAGILHTNGENFQPSIIDGPGDNRDLGWFGPGNDGIVGTFDDTPIEFVTDEFDLTEGLFGFQRVADSLAFTLTTGKVGTAITGRAFNDLNRNGSGTGDAGIAGVTVFADINGNGIRDTGELSTLTGTDGTFSIGAPTGNYSIVAIPPANFGASTPTSIAANSGALNFGFYRTTSDATGTVTDTNGNPIEGVYVYLDLDGDKRPDLGEPATNSAANGTYSLNFPGIGTYTIFVVVPSGFRQVTPASGTGVQVQFNGTSIVQPGTSLPVDARFVFEASTDFGDAPASYGSASHGIINGLSLGGALIDPETSSQSNATATGDDADGLDDEDSVLLTSPLARGGTSTFTVNVINTTGSTAYLQAFMDFDQNGVFTDPGEQFVINLPIASGAGTQAIPVSVTVPTTATLGTTFARFRLSQSIGIGATGFASSGEVEDHTFTIMQTTDLANDDPDPTNPGSMTVSRNSTANVLNVLANDFQAPGNGLTISNLNLAGAVGQISISGDRKAVLYTPPNGFVGSDSFSYTVRDQFGNTSSADVTVTVQFQSASPIAVDDSFEVPTGSSNRALNVLENDVPSAAGGISVISVTSGSAGGFLSVTGGGQSIRYTPQAGFNGTEQFTYTIQDSAGQISSAIGTVHLLPGAILDDIVRFSLEILDQDGVSLEGENNEFTPTVRVGDTFQIRVSVDDVRSLPSPEGVASASMDLLYSAALVAVKNANPLFNGGFPFDISFGQLFGGLRDGDINTPGLLNDAGGIQTAADPGSQVEHSGPVELFTVTMQAVAPGVAQFIGDPSENQLIETTVIGSDQGLTPSQLGFERTELLILPKSSNFTSAVEDSFPKGVDSNGNPISSGTTSPAVLRVLANDNLRVVDGQPASITQRGLVSAPSLGTATFNDNGTPGNLNDDFISYRPFVGASGLEQFSYFIVDDEGSSSVAQVSIAIGNNNANADVAMDFQLVRENGTLINPAVDSIRVGERIGVQVHLEDIRPFPSYVFVGFLDVLYSTGTLEIATDVTGDLCSAHNGLLATELDFVACIGVEYIEDGTTGSASQPGLINEFGSVARELNDPDGSNPALLATIFFDVIAPGTAQITGSPADRFPESETGVFGNDDAIEISKIRYDSVQFEVLGSALQNARFPQDVDADGEATALDALIIINRMGRTVEGQGTAPADGYFTDVNGDFKVTALDALQVINYIARRKTAGEAEAKVTPQAVRSASASTEADVSDAVFADFGADQVSKVVAVDSSGGQFASATPIINGTDDDHDEEDGLDLFADDVFGQWN